LFLESLPSVALFTAVAVWAAISLSSDHRLPVNSVPTTVVPYDRQAIFTAQGEAKLLRSEGSHDERFGTLSACKYLRQSAATNGNCIGGRLNQTVVVTNGTLGMCFVRNKEIGAKLELNDNSTFSSGYTGWRLLLFRMSRISDRLHKSLCFNMSLGYRNETASACNGQVTTINGYPDVIILSAQQWNDMVFYIPHVLLAMLHCRPYAGAEN
jgi:hypothetical protein